MPTKAQSPFSQQLKTFKKGLSNKKQAGTTKLMLFIMANTHDKTLSKDCIKDKNNIKTVFKNISKHFKLEFCCIEVVGKHYHFDNLDKAIDAVDVSALGNDNNVIIFYYTGHGFSYKNDRYNKYPQLDMRPHNKQVDYNNIHFIKQHTINLEALLNIIRFRGCRINIAIADCCNTTIPYKRPKLNEHDMWVSNKILPAKSKQLTKKIFTDYNKDISILVSSSQFGQPAIADSGKGSIFTNFFTKALAPIVHSHTKGEAYVPWLKVLKKSAAQAFKESKGYDIGGGVAGKQKAVFEVYIEQE